MSSLQYDLHMHTLLSDGEMLPIELVRRVSVLGYTTIAISDHADSSNITELLTAVRRIQDSSEEFGVHLLCGVELTHVPPSLIPVLAHQAKQEGADIVVVHGETVVEPVAPGTNRVACRCRDVDILAHPGLIDEGDAQAAAENGVALEITSRAGHNRTNGHVVNSGRDAGCIIVVNSDAHAPHDLLDRNDRLMIARGAGMTEPETENSLSLNINRWLSKKR
ncbi:MAG: histidinol phosphate phosphatase domain-containing protein [Methanomicrobiales archaeon]|nr:histidinol phosphate phosphatase domain-containing protein [Methanomicrobiales archaeon]